MILTILKTLVSKALVFIRKYWKQLLLVLLGAVFALKLQSCVRRVLPHKNSVSEPSNPSVQPLPKNDTEQITVKNNEVQVITSKGTTVTNGSRGVTIDVKKDGSVVVTPKTHGFVLNPQLGAGINNTGVKGTVGVELYFYKKLDLLGGLGVDKYLAHTSVFLAVGYTPESKWIHNTSFWIGPAIDITGTKSLMCGVAVRI